MYLPDLDAILEHYRAEGYYPSAVCHVFNETDTLYRKAFGDVTENTWFDLASVSKIICTTMLLCLMDEGKLTPEDKILSHLPVEKMGAATLARLESVTVYQLLTHTSGIVPWFPFYSDGREFYTVLERVLSSTKVEEGMAYSDLNFMLLAQIFTHISGLSLREGLDTYIKPIVGSEIAYGPMADPSICAPTCYGNQIEQRMCAERNLTFDGWRPNGVEVRGSCNDGNAHYYWGGASGHAGIFATSTALMKLCQFYLTTDKPAFLRAMEETTFDRGLGFDKTNVFPDGCGHTGFTGTSIWISREHHLGAVILTNKFHRMEGEPPGSSHEFRRAVHYGLIGKPIP